MGKVFISYRRKDSDFTRHLVEKLKAKLNDDVFWDYEIAEDDFARALLRQVRECDVFVLVVSDHTFALDRIHNPDDWIIREVAEALRLEKPTALALYEGKVPPYDLRDQLPQSVRGIVSKQGIPILGAAFEACVDRLAQHCVNISGGWLSVRVTAAGAMAAPPASSGTVTVSGDSSIGIGNARDVIINQSDRAHDIRCRELKQRRDTLRHQLNSLPGDAPQSPVRPTLILVAGAFSMVGGAFMLSGSVATGTATIVTTILLGMILYRLSSPRGATASDMKQKREILLAELHSTDQQIKESAC